MASEDSAPAEAAGFPYALGVVAKYDILALTKLNYNACLYADGDPITLKFADAVGEVLTAGPLPGGGPPLPFRYYI